MASQDREKKRDVEDGKAEVKKKFDLDTILVEEIGQFGKYQIRTAAVAYVLVIFTAWAASEYIFTTARIGSRCSIPECDSDQPEFSPSWLSNAVPQVDGSSDQCVRYPNITSSADNIAETNTCPSSLFDQSTTITCDDHVYENTHSVAYDFGLACDEWRRSLIGTVRTFGALLALPIVGFVSDRWGRRVALAISAFNTAWLGLVRYWADTYIGFMMSELMEAVFGSGVFSCIYILLMEVTGPKYRVAVGASVNTCFSVGTVLMGLIAWGVPNWKNLTLVLYVPQLFSIACYWLVSESVRWYISKDRYTDCELVLKKIAQVNGKQLSDKSLVMLRQSAEEEKLNQERQKEIKKNEPWLIVQVFRHKLIFLRCLVSPVWWVTTTFVYYGLSINSVNISGNRYFNYIAVSLVDIPGYWAAFYLMGKLGRKPLLTTAFWISGICQIVYIFLPNNQYALSLTMYLIAKFAIAMTMTGIYVYTAELYPTNCRHTLFAYSSMIGRIGSMVAPLTPAVGAQWFAELPFALFAIFALVSGSLVFLTPETLGTTLPNTFEEAEALGRKPKSNATS